MPLPPLLPLITGCFSAGWSDSILKDRGGREKLERAAIFKYTFQPEAGCSLVESSSLSCVVIRGAQSGPQAVEETARSSETDPASCPYHSHSDEKEAPGARKHYMST